MRPTLSLLCLLWAFFPSIDHLGAIAIPTPQEPALHGPELLPRTSKTQKVSISLYRGPGLYDEKVKTSEMWTIYIGATTGLRLDNQKPFQFKQNKPHRVTEIGHVTFKNMPERTEVVQAMVDEVQGARTNLIYIIRSLAKLEEKVGAENFKLEEDYYKIVGQMLHEKGTADRGVISDDETTAQLYEQMEKWCESRA
ncbi:hypothetical protein F5050DRAFT_124492 [Lentinula boryana]|uniref:Uncharacterized protein n=1 Tax=Lentinula boryana TaxID=40481 RepID=A0ABQ8QCY9_9AGAR|nr:hypothetical protein F5050DRAFT_124492 [Lentinula boryana]